jgi:hypothetical protein
MLNYVQFSFLKRTICSDSEQLECNTGIELLTWIHIAEHYTSNTSYTPF